MKRTISFLIACLWCGVSYAENGEAPDSLVNLGELNVVALKQEERLRNEAVASTTLGEIELERLNVATIKGMSDVVPNFYVPDYGSRITSSMYVRGLGARMDQPAVGLTVDNVPVLNKNGYDFDIADIESVEMLRGAQSTLYGRNTMGGLINITTISPSRFEGWRIMAQGAGGFETKASAGWYHSFTDKFASAFIASFSGQRGFFKNEYTGKYLDHELCGAFRWKADLKVSDDVRIQNAFSGSLLRQGGYPYESVADGRICYNDSCGYRRGMISDGLTINWRAPGFRMTSITTFQYLDDSMTLDQDFLPESFFTLTQAQKESGVTEDIVFRGEAADGRYSWLAGGFFFGKFMSMDAPVTFKDKGIANLIESHRNSANPSYPIEWDSREFVLGSRFENPTVGGALYHESRLVLGEWKFTLGLRLDCEESRLHYRSNCATGYEIFHRQPDGSLDPYTHIDVNINDNGRLRRTFFNWMPRLSILRRFGKGDNFSGNAYLTISKGYKSGGFNTQMFSDVLQQRLMGIMGLVEKYEVEDIVSYRPEYSWNYEAGAHFEFPAGRLQADAALFYIDCRDQQLTTFPDGTTTGRIMTNAGRTRSFGAEVSATWNPIDNMAVNVSYGFTDARFIRFNNGIADMAGKFLPYAPRNTFFASVAYNFPFRHRYIKSLDLEGSVSGAGKIYWNDENSLSQNIYFLPGASATLHGGRWSVQIWGKNLSSTRYYTFYFMSMGNEFVQRGRPIQGGITFRINI